MAFQVPFTVLQLDMEAGVAVVVPFALELPVAASRVEAWALNETGQRNGELTVEARAGGSRVIADGSADTLWYEISVAAE